MTRKSRYNNNFRQLSIDFSDLSDLSDFSDRSEKTENTGHAIEDTRLFFISLGSGSSGNASYIGTASAGIIVDAGIPADTIEKRLHENGIEMSKVKALLLTHDHTDHVRYAYTLLRSNRHIHLMCTNRVLNGMLRRHNISKRIKEYHYPIFKEIPFRAGDFEITAFDVPHDGSDNMGFSIDFCGRRFVIATDLGEVAGRARHYVEQANYLVIEANYDAAMLRNGLYPEYLKARIATAHGHMDNADTARLLAEIVRPELQYVFLCHLSEDNNTPEIASLTVRKALIEKGLTVGDCSHSTADRAADIHLMPLPRFDATRLFVLR